MLPVLLVSIDNTVLSFALPAIARDLQPSSAGQLWIIDAYPLVLAGLLVAMGNLGDRFGRRKLLLIGATGFAIVSIVAAFAPTAEALIAARVLLGVFGATLMPSTLSLLRSLFLDDNQRRLAIAIWATGFSAGSAIGPLVGGILLEHFWWGSVFLVAVPFLIPLLVLAPVIIPESKDPNPGPFDTIGIGLSMVTLIPIVYAIKHMATDGVDLLAVGLLLVGAIAGYLFVRRQNRRPQPMLDMRLFGVSAFSGGVVVNLVSVISLVGFLFFVTQHLQLVVGLSPIDAALVLAPGVVMMIVAGLAVVPIAKRIPAAWVVGIGLLCSATGYLLMGIVGDGATIGTIVTAFVLLGIGIGAAETLSNDMILASVPPAKAGAASGVSETAYELGAVLGTAVLGSILTAAYRSNLVIPDGVSAADARAATETLAGAADVADRLDSTLGAALLESAHHAFDSGVVWTSFVGATLMVGAAVLAVFTLRHRAAKDSAASNDAEPAEAELRG